MNGAIEASGLPGHADAFSPELLAALAGGFRRMLAEQAPATSAPKAEHDLEAFIPNTSKVTLPKKGRSMTRETTYKVMEMRPSSNPVAEEIAPGATGRGLPTNSSYSTVRTEANGGKTTSGPKIQRIRATDMAFPSANNFLDHSPNAPFDLDAHELANTAVPANQRYGEGLHKIEDTEEPSNRLKMKSKKSSHSEGDTTSCIMEVGLNRAVTAFVICDLETRRFLRAHPLFKTLLHAEPHASQLAFHIAELPGRGKGLVASRLIKAGECILREPPLLVAKQGMGHGTAERFHQALGRDMHYRTLIALDSLDNCHDEPGVSTRFGIIRTNAIAIDFPTAKDPLCGIFELISRLNHSCDRNVDFRWSYKDLQGSIWARKDIMPGEELLWSYVNPMAPKKTRRAELLKKHKFFCTCTKCGPA